MSASEEPRWRMLWNLGLLIGLIGLPGMLGFFAGGSIEASTVDGNASTLPWRLVFCGLGAVVGAFAAWRTVLAKRSGEGE